MGLSAAARARGLKAMVPDRVWMGLATAILDGAITEVKDPAYRRQQVTFGDVAVDGRRSVRYAKESVAFPSFMFDTTKELRFWFLTSEREGNGIVWASAELEPVMMLGADNKVFSPAQAVGRKDLTPVYPRVLAGWTCRFDAKDIALFIEEGD